MQVRSATYADAANSSAVVETTDNRSVLLSQADRPVEWALLLASGMAIAPFVAPNPPPVDISRRQFAQGLAELGLISEIEAEDFSASGALPPALLFIVGQLPQEQRFPARMLLRATDFAFAHPLAEAFAALASPPWSTETRAAFWRHCATL